MRESKSIIRQSSASFLDMEKLIRDTGSDPDKRQVFVSRDVVFNENSLGVEKEQKVQVVSVFFTSSAMLTCQQVSWLQCTIEHRYKQGWG